MPPPIKLVLVEDHPIFREGLLRVIGRDPTFQVVGEAGDGISGEEKICELRPDIAILDINLPGRSGLDLAQRLVDQKHPVRVVILTMHKTEALLDRALEAQVSGYVLKESAAPELLNCLRAVSAGERYISPALSGLMLRKMSAPAGLRARKPGLADLTRMERQVLRLVAESRTTKEIAAALFISPYTVQTHRKNICAKLDLHSVHGLLQFALEHKAEL